jgi:hypothetical protein
MNLTNGRVTTTGRGALSSSNLGNLRTSVKAYYGQSDFVRKGSKSKGKQPRLAAKVPKL